MGSKAVIENVVLSGRDYDMMTIPEMGRPLSATVIPYQASVSLAGVELSRSTAQAYERRSASVLRALKRWRHGKR